MRARAFCTQRITAYCTSVRLLLRHNVLSIDAHCAQKERECIGRRYGVFWPGTVYSLHTHVLHAKTYKSSARFDSTSFGTTRCTVLIYIPSANIGIRHTVRIPRQPIPKQNTPFLPKFYNYLCSVSEPWLPDSGVQSTSSENWRCRWK